MRAKGQVIGWCAFVLIQVCDAGRINMTGRLPVLRADEKAEDWLARTLLPEKKQNDTRWWQYQTYIFKQCDEVWRKTRTRQRSRLVDINYYDLWRRRMPQYGFVYLPLPWNEIIEQFAQYRSDCQPFSKVIEIITNLDLDAYPHFITPGQATLTKIPANCQPSPVYFRAVKRMITFSSRLLSMLRYQATPDEIPIPLLHHEELEITLSKTPKKQSAFFAGSCSCKAVRTKLHALASSNVYNMTQVNACQLHQMDRFSFIHSIQNSLWTLTPRGSNPATYSMSEAIQAGSLPVYIYHYKCSRATRKAPITPDELASHLPYFNIGLDWRDFGHILIFHNLLDLPRRLSTFHATSDTERRLRLLDRIRPFYTVDGSFRYILSVLSHLADTSPSSHNFPVLTTPILRQTQQQKMKRKRTAVMRRKVSNYRKLQHRSTYRAVTASG